MTDDVSYVAISPNYWGSGDTEKKAIKKVLTAGARTGDRYDLYRIVGIWSISEIDGTLYAKHCEKLTWLTAPKLPSYRNGQLR
jgi:hypothetical protein